MSWPVDVFSAAEELVPAIAAAAPDIERDRAVPEALVAGWQRRGSCAPPHRERSAVWSSTR